MLNSSKKAQENINSLTIQEYNKAIFDNTTISGKNKGFRMHYGKM